MKRTIFFALALCLAVLSGCGGKTVPEVKPLQVEGTVLYAGDEPFCARGVSFGWHNIWPRFYNEAAAEKIVSVWGAPILRAAIGVDDHAKSDNPDCHGGYITEPEFALECLCSVIDGAVRSGAYVIVDWHSHTLHKAEAEEFFAKVAELYKDCPNVIYELFNEPVSREFEDSRDYSEPTQESLDAYWAELKDYAESIISIIDKTSSCHPLILMGCPRWDQAIDAAARNPITTYDNLMYTVHFYAATHKGWLRDRTDRAIEAGLPVFISECAACEASGDGPVDEESWNEWNDWAAERGITMLTWSISDKAETCSMFTPEASSEGPWSDDVIKPWGKTVKEWLRK